MGVIYYFLFSEGGIESQRSVIKWQDEARILALVFRSLLVCFSLSEKYVQFKYQFIQFSFFHEYTHKLQKKGSPHQSMVI